MEELWRFIADRWLLLALLGTLLAAPVTPATARDAYVANVGSSDISVIDTATNQVLGAPIPIATGPVVVAITPDGRHAYVSDNGSNDVSVIDTATNQLGAPIPVGANPGGVAITPDGGRAYVANVGSNDVSVIDTATNQVLGGPIPVGINPRFLAITPDGGHAYVANNGSDDVSVIDTATNLVIGAPIPVGTGPGGVAITPDGRRVYVANLGSNNISVIDTATNQVIGAPIPTGIGPGGVAITPDGGHAYNANNGSNDVSVIDTAINQVVGAPIAVGAGPAVVALMPDGKRAYVTNAGSNDISVIDSATNQVVGVPIPVGATPIGLAIVPDQPPHASFTDPSALLGERVRFNAAASTDPDGEIAGYAWNFGDGTTATKVAPTVTHVYRHRGSYRVRLTLTDNAGCSTSLIFTGQTALCNGSSLASAAHRLKVGFPKIPLRCPTLARGACRMDALAVTRNQKRHGRTESKTVRANVKPGKSKIVTLRIKKAFQAKIGRSKSVTTRQRITVRGHTHTRYQRLRLKRP